MIESRRVSALGTSMIGADRTQRAIGSRSAILALLLAGAAMTTAAPVAAAGILDLGGLPSLRTNFDNGGADYDFVQHGALQIAPTSNLSYAGILRDGGVGETLSLEKLGNFTLTLSGANTYTGTTLVGGGTLRAGASNTFSAGSLLVNNATVELDGFSQTVAGLTGPGDVLNSSGGSATLTIDIAAGTQTQSGNLIEVAGNALSLVKTGAGSQIINGVNNFSGGTLIANGVLGYGNAASLGTGAVVFNTGGAPGAIATLRAAGTATVLTNDLTLTTDGTIDGSGHSPVFTGLISGAGKLTKRGLGFVRIDNTGNSYAGGTDITQGELLLGASNVLGSGVVTVSAAAKLNAVTSASLNNDIVLNAGLKVDRAGTTLTLNGAIAGGAGNNLTVDSGATLNLTHANTYAGSTFVTSTLTDSSVLGIGNNLAVGGGAHQIIATGVDAAHPAIIRALGNFTLPVGNTIRVNGALSIDTNGNAFGIDGKINDLNAFNAGSLTVDGGGTLTLGNASNGYTLGTTVQGFSQLAVTNDAQLGGGNAAVNLINGFLDIVGNGFGATTRAINLTGFGVVDVQSAAAIVDLGLVQGAGQLYKFGAGTFTLAGVNTYSGGTFVDAGTIDFKSNNAFGTGFVYLAPGARITTSVNGLVLENDFNLDGGTIQAGAANLTLNGDLGGTGPLIKTGSGRFELNGNNGYTGGTTVVAGGLRLGSNTALGTNVADFFAGTALAASIDLAVANDLQLDGNIQIDTEGHTVDLQGNVFGVGGFVKINPGTLVLSGIGVNTGTTQVQGGTLQVDGTIGNVSVAAAGTLTGTGTLGVGTVSGTIAPGVGGVGTLTFSSLTLNSGSFLNFELGAPAAVHDEIIVNTNLALDGTLNIANLGGLAMGTYTLFTYGGALSGPGLSIGSVPGGFLSTDFTITSGGGLVQLGVLLGAGPYLYWDGGNMAANGAIDGGSGVWNATNTNWTSATGTTNGAYAGAVGNFQAVPGTVTVVGTQTFDQLNFAVNGYILNGDTLAGSVVATIDVAGGATTVINNVVSGANGLRKQGAGTLELSGANTFNGLDLAAGTVVLDSSASVGGFELDLANGTTLAAGANLNFTNDIVLAAGQESVEQHGHSIRTGNISGAGQLVVTDDIGGGVLFLKAGNTYTGGTYLLGGSASIADDTALGGGNLQINNATLFTTATLSTSRSVVLLSGSGGTFDVDTGTTTTLTGVVSGTVLHKTGSGRLDLLNAGNTYSGGTDLQAGILEIATDDALGAGDLTFSGPAKLRALADISSARTVILAADGTVDTNGFQIVLGSVTDAAGSFSLTKVGTGNLLLGSSNTYDGGTLLNGGSLQIYDGTSIGTGTLTAADGTGLIAGEAGGPLAFTLGNDIVLNGALTVDLTGNAGASFSGSNGTFTGNGTNPTLAGQITGTGSLSVINRGNLTIAGTDASGPNTYSGGTTVSLATIAVGANDALGSGAVDLSNAGLLNNSGGALTVGNAINVSLASWLGGNDPLTLSGAINGTGVLYKLSGNALILTNAASDFGGTIQSLGGLLQVDGALTNAAAIVTLTNGGTLGGTGSIAGTVNVGSGSVAPGDSPGTITFGTLNLAAASNLNFEFATPNSPGGLTNDRIIVTGALTLDGTLNVSTPAAPLAQGIYNIATYGTLNNNGLNLGVLPALAGGATASINISSPGFVNLIIAGAGFEQFWDGDAVGNANNGVVNGGNGTWTAGSPNWTTANGALNVNWQGHVGTFQGTAGTVGVDFAAGFEGFNFLTGGYALTDAGGGSLVTSGASFVNTASAAGDVTVFDIAVTGAGSLVKQGAAFLDLVRANSYTGGTDIQQGIVRLYDSASAGTGAISMANGTVLDLVSNGQSVGNNLVLTGSDRVRAYQTASLTGVVSGTGKLISDQFSGGTLTLANAANSYSGGTDLDAGTLAIGSDHALGAGFTALTFTGASTLQFTASVDLFRPVVLNATGTIDTNGFDSNVLGGFVSGAGKLIKAGAGQLSFYGGSSNTGGTDLTAGAIRIENGSSIGSGTLTTTGGTTFVAGAFPNANITFANDVVLGAGTTTLDVVGTNSVQVYATDTYSSNGTILGLSGGISGAGTLNVVGTGKVTFAGNNSYAGGTVVDQALVSVTNGNSLGTGALTLNGFSGLRNNTAGTVTLANDVVFNGATNTVGGTGNLTLAGGISGGADLVKVNSDTVNLTGDASGFTGDTDVVNGKLLINTFFGAGGGQSVNVLTGATLGGAGIITANVNVGSNAIYAPGNSPGTMIIIGNLNFANNAIINYDLGQASVIGGPNNDQTTVFGNLSFGANSTLNVTDSLAFGLGVYNLFTYTGTLSGTGPNTVNLPGAFTGVVQSAVPGFVNLIVAAPGALVQYWDGADILGNGAIDGGTGTWNNSNTNWTTGAPSVLNSTWAGGVAVFQGAAGTVNLTANESFQGLQFSTNGYVLNASGAGGLTINAPVFIATDPGVTATINAGIGGAGSILKQNTGTLVLNAANTYTGGTTVSAGTLQVGNNAALGTGGLVLQGGTTLAAGAPNLTIANAVQTNGIGTVNSGPGVFTLAGTISGAGSINKTGTGNLVLTGNNSFDGLNVAAGSVGVATNTAAGIGLITLNGTLLGATVSGLTLANNFLINGASTIDSSSGVLTLNGTISGPGSINKVNVGNLILNGNNSFNGLNISSGGTVTLGTNTAGGIGNINISNNATLAAGLSGLVVANTITTPGVGTVDSGPGVMTLNGVISGAGSIRKTNTGNLVLNQFNTYNGLDIVGGTVTVGTNTAGGVGNINIGDGTILAAGLSGLVLNNTITTPGGGRVNSGPGIFTLNGTISGAGSLSQIGTGNLVLNGNNSFNGLGINQGTVTLGTNTAGGIGTITINDGAILAAGVDNLVVANVVETTGGGRVDTKAFTTTLNGTIGGVGSLSHIGAGNLILNGNNSFNGLGINQGTVTVGTNTAAGIGTITINDGAILAAGANGLALANVVETTGGGRVNSGPGIFTLNGTIGGVGSLSQIGTGNLVLNGNNSFNGLGINQGTVTLGTNTAGGIGTITINNGAILAAGVDNLVVANVVETTGGGRVDTKAFTTTLNGTIGGVGSISQIGTGNLILNGNNTFAAGLGINQGTVTLGSNTAAGTGTIAINDGAILAAATIAAAGAPAGLSGFTLDGTVTGTNPFGTGIFSLSNYNLLLNGNNSFAGLGGAPTVITLANNIITTGGGRIDSGAGTLVLNGQIGGAGSISQVGTGNLVLNGTNLFAAGLGINRGQVTLGTSTAAGTGSIAINNGAILAAGVDGLVVANGVQTTGGGRVDTKAFTMTLNGNIGGAGSISQIGTGNLILNGNNTFAAGLGINQGTVTLGTNTAAGTGAIAINEGAILAAGVSGLVVANHVETTGGGRINSGPGVFTLNGTIGGAGSISQIGTGNLVLNGANTFAAGLGINQGTVTLGTSTSAGTGAITINNGGILAAGVSGLVVSNHVETTGGGRVDSGAGVFTLSGMIGGPGSISQIGTGNLILNGANTFIAGLGINQGTVTLGTNTSAGVGTITINNGGILAAGVSGLVVANDIQTTGGGRVDSGAGVLTLNGVIGNNGSISQIGTGNLVLNGNNTFTAGLGINQGTVTLGTNTAAGTGTLTINNGAILAAGVSGLVVANNIQTTGGGRVNSGSGTLTLNGVIGNNGSISQIGTGNLVLNGANTFTGGLGVNIGTVTLGSNTAAGTGTIALNAATLAAGVSGLTVANAIQTTGGGRVDSGTGTFTLSGAIGNTGGLTKVGTGNLVLSGTSNYTGGTTVSAGRLTVSGALTASAVTVATGGTLAGAGSVTSFSAQSGSTVSPGAPEGTVGTLSVTGNASFASGSTYLVTVSGTTSDRIAIGGTATLGGANLSVALGAAPATFGTTYTVLTATGGRTGTFTPLFSGFGQAFNPTIVYGANDVRLTLAPASIVGLLGSGAGGSQNIVNFAAAFDASVASGFNPQAFFPIFLQSGAALGASLNQLTGEITSANSRTAIADTRLIRDAALDRLGASLGGGSNGRGDAVTTTGDADHSISFWATGVGSWTDSKADGNGSKLNIDAKGIVTGIDASFGEWKVGALFNYIDSKVDTVSLGRGTVDSTGGGLYAGYRGEHGFAAGIGGAVSHVSSKENRAITTPGIGQSLKSKTSGTVYQVFGEISYDLAAAENTRVEPFVRAAYVSYKVDAINEAGGFAALNVAKGKYDSTIITGGLRGSVLLGGSAWLKGSAGYQYTTGDRSPVSLVSLAGTSGQAAIRAVALDKSAFAGELGIDFRVTPNITLGAGYNGVIGKNTQDHGIRGTLTIGF